MSSLRQTLRDLMVRLHGITRELADYHASRMSDAEVEEHFTLYVRNGLVTGMESSAVGPTNNRGQRLFYPVGDAPDDDGRLAALNSVPGFFCRSCSEPLADEAIFAIHLAAGHKITGYPMPESGKKVTGSLGADGVCPRVKSLALATDAECGDM